MLESIGSTDGNKVNSLIDLRLIKFIVRAEIKEKMISNPLVDSNSGCVSGSSIAVK